MPVIHGQTVVRIPLFEAKQSVIANSAHVQQKKGRLLNIDVYILYNVGKFISITSVNGCHSAQWQTKLGQDLPVMFHL